MDHPAVRDQSLLRAIVLDAWDGSIPGIWEAFGEVRGAYPELPEDTARQIAASILIHLAREGSIELLRVSAPDEQHSEPVAEMELESTLSLPSSWQPSGSGGFTLNMASTAAGERRYHVAE